jgi:dihydrofolate synthase/folylpolyglutamate synthase
MNREASASQPVTLDEWLRYIERIHPQGIAMGLERVVAVKQALVLNPGSVVITVGGTNGKGSACAMLEAILSHAGYKVGCYTSPHLLRYNERVRVDRHEAADAQLVRAFAAVEAARKGIAHRSAEQGPHAWGCDREDAQTADKNASGTPENFSEAVQLTYFEFGTLAAAWLFTEARVDAAILEVGLGGRLDAVNVFDGDCALIMSVALDHMDYLGATREEIGYEKAGILRAGRPAICADPDPPQSMRRHAAQIGARLLVRGPDFDFSADRTQWRYDGPHGSKHGLPYPVLRGTHQLANASACIAALDSLRERLPVSVNDIRTGLLQAETPGRFQILPGRPAVILDVAHNPEAAAALAANLAEMGGSGRTIAVFAMLRDKDIAGVVAALQSRIDCWFVAGISAPRGADAEFLAEALRAAHVAGAIVLCGNIAEAYAQACDMATQNDRILVFGSFYTVAAVMQARAMRQAPPSS